MPGKKKPQPKAAAKKKPQQVNRPPGQGTSKAAKRRRAKKQMLSDAYVIASQNTSKSMVSSSNKRSIYLACAISLPHESNGDRFPTADFSRTSVGRFSDQLGLSSPTSAITNWNTGDLLIAFHGQPNRLAMYTYQPPTGAVLTYTLNFEWNGGVANVWYLVIGNAASTSGSLVIAQPWPLVSGTVATSNVTYPWHGSTMPVGTSHDKKFVWLTYGESITFSLPNAPITGQFVVGVYQWAPNNSFTTAEVRWPLTGGATSILLYTSTSSGYYAFEVLREDSGSALPTGNYPISVTWNSANPPYVTWATMHMGDLDPAVGGDLNLGRETRVNAASLLCTNTTSLLNRQGNVIAARINEAPFYQVTPEILGRAAEPYFGDAAKGVYTYKEFSLYDESYRSMTGGGGLQFDLDLPTYFHFIQLGCPGANNSYNVSASVILEYIVDIPRYPKGVSPFEFADLLEARRIINESPGWFFENPMHWADILRMIKTGASGAYKGLKRYGPTTARALAGVMPGYSPLMNATAGLLESLP